MLTTPETRRLRQRMNEERDSLIWQDTNVLKAFNSEVCITHACAIATTM